MATEPATKDQDKKRILVVDDHEDNVEVLRARLEARGYDVEGAMDDRLLSTPSRAGAPT